jgi:hypothetical protein
VSDRKGTVRRDVEGGVRAEPERLPRSARADLGSIVHRMEVDDREMRIIAAGDTQEQALLANGTPVPGVRSFVRKWRTGQVCANSAISVG